MCFYAEAESGLTIIKSTRYNGYNDCELIKKINFKGLIKSLLA